MRSNNTSGAKGVKKRKHGRYDAAIGFGGEDHHIGTFDNLIDAAKAYNEAALKHHGKYARLNIIDGV